MKGSLTGSGMTGRELRVLVKGARPEMSRRFGRVERRNNIVELDWTGAVSMAQ